MYFDGNNLCSCCGFVSKRFKQDDRYHKRCTAFSKFYRRHNRLVEKCNVSLKNLLQQGISASEF